MLAMATMHGRCRISSTDLFSPAEPFDVSEPSGSTTTPWKNDTEGGMSVGVRPFLAAARVNSSRPAGLAEYTSPHRTSHHCRRVWKYRRGRRDDPNRR